MSDHRTMTTTDMRKQFSEQCFRVQYAGDVVVLTRRGKPVAALVSMETLAHGTDSADLERLYHANGWEVDDD